MDAPTLFPLPVIFAKAVEQILPAFPIDDLTLAASYARQDKAPSTRQAYRSDFAQFQSWCDSRGVCALPASAEAVAAFLAHEASRGMSASTIGRRCAAIRHVHRIAEFEAPTSSEKVRATVRGIRRSIGCAGKPKAPATADVLRPMVQAAPAGRLKGLRDRALLLLGFGGAFRRSELVALDVADIEFCEDGLRVTIRRSKTDQEGQGTTIAVIRGTGAFCPAKALRAWLDAAGITEGAIFRPVRKGGHIRDRRLTAKSVCDLVKAYAASIGLDASNFGAHSLRSGFLTSAARRGASIFKMQDVSRHKSMDVLRGYVRDAEIFVNHAGAGLL